MKGMSRIWVPVVMRDSPPMPCPFRQVEGQDSQTQIIIIIILLVVKTTTAHINSPGIT